MLVKMKSYAIFIFSSVKKLIVLISIDSFRNG